MRNEIKIEKLFNLFDDKQRGFLESGEMLSLMKTIEKLFAKEKSDIDFRNYNLFYNNAEHRAASNFKFIKCMIDHQLGQKKVEK